MRVFRYLVTSFALLTVLPPVPSVAKEVHLLCREASGTESKKSDTIRDAASDRVVKEEEKALRNLMSIHVSIDPERRVGYVRGERATVKVEPFRLSLWRDVVDSTEWGYTSLGINRQDLTFTYDATSSRHEKVVGLLQNEYTTTRRSRGMCTKVPTSGNQI